EGGTGGFGAVLTPAGLGGLAGARGLGFGPDGKFYLISSANNAVLRYDASTGAFLDSITGGGLDGPTFFTFLSVGATPPATATVTVHNVPPVLTSPGDQSGFLP